MLEKWSLVFIELLRNKSFNVSVILFILGVFWHQVWFWGFVLFSIFHFVRQLVDFEYTRRFTSSRQRRERNREILGTSIASEENDVDTAGCNNDNQEDEDSKVI